MLHKQLTWFCATKTTINATNNTTILSILAIILWRRNNTTIRAWSGFEWWGSWVWKVLKEVNGTYSAVAIKFLVISFFPCFKVVVGLLGLLSHPCALINQMGPFCMCKFTCPNNCFRICWDPPKMLSLSPDKLQLTEANWNPYEIRLHITIFEPTSNYWKAMRDFSFWPCNSGLVVQKVEAICSSSPDTVLISLKMKYIYYIYYIKIQY